MNTTKIYHLWYVLKHKGETYSGKADFTWVFLWKIWSISFGSTISIWQMSVSSLLHTSMSSQSLFVELLTNEIEASSATSTLALIGVDVTGADVMSFLLLSVARLPFSFFLSRFLFSSWLQKNYVQKKQ